MTRRIFRSSTTPLAFTAAALCLLAGLALAPNERAGVRGPEPGETGSRSEHPPSAHATLVLDLPAICLSPESPGRAAARVVSGAIVGHGRYRAALRLPDGARVRSLAITGRGLGEDGSWVGRLLRVEKLGAGAGREETLATVRPGSRSDGAGEYFSVECASPTVDSARYDYFATLETSPSAAIHGVRIVYEPPSGELEFGAHRRVILGPESFQPEAGIDPADTSGDAPAGSGRMRWVSAVALPANALVTGLRIEAAHAGASQDIVGRLSRVDGRSGERAIMVEASLANAPNHPGASPDRAVPDGLIDHARFFYFAELEMDAPAGVIPTLEIAYSLMGTAGVDFTTQIRPLFRGSCDSCHNLAARNDNSRNNGLSFSPSFTLRDIYNEVTNADGIELRSRVDTVTPTASRLLQFPSQTGAGSAHTGGRIWPAGQATYNLVLAWISEGARLCPDDGNPCTDEAFNDTTSLCETTNNTGSCSDGDACTTGDTCSGGTCQVGTGTLSCNDANLCTDDSCDPAMGCVNAPNTAACSDGSPCTTGDQCTNGACVGGLPPGCDDGLVCTNDSCNPSTGQCIHSNNTAACSDNNLCTTGDVCGGGACQPGAGALNCNDNNACTQDSCNAATGCSHTVLTAVSGFSKTRAPAGTNITITGTNLGSTTKVLFGGSDGVESPNISRVTATSIRARVPAGVLTGPIVARSSNGCNAASESNFYGVPLVRQFFPVASQIGSQVTISGNNLLGTERVLFKAKEGRVQATFFLSNHDNTEPWHIQATVPMGAVTGNIKIAGPGGTSVTPAPFIVQP